MLNFLARFLHTGKENRLKNFFLEITEQEPG
jgi:hypothetical protein